MSLQESYALSATQEIRPKKGEVRQEILNLLSKQPYTVTELASILGISKPTVAYHLSYLREKGLTNINRVEVDKRGFERKYYGIERPLQFMLESKIEEKYLKLVTEIFAGLKNHIGGSNLEPIGRLLRGGLYHVFRMLPNITGRKHSEILHGQGQELGEEVGRRIEGKSFREILNGIRRFWQENKIGDIEIPWVQRKTGIFAMHDCLGCDVCSSYGAKPEMNSPLCHFVIGLMDGILKSKLGEGYEISRVEFQKPGNMYCKFQISYRRTDATAPNSSLLEKSEITLP